MMRLSLCVVSHAHHDASVCVLISVHANECRQCAFLHTDRHTDRQTHHGHGISIHANECRQATGVTAASAPVLRGL